MLQEYEQFEEDKDDGSIYSFFEMIAILVSSIIYVFAIVYLTYRIIISFS